MRLALIIEYEGTRYRGFQYQANAPTIQGELERAIRRFTGECARVKAAGRTDAGVHALGQVIAFDTDAAHPPATAIGALNYHLPGDIAVKAAFKVGDDFDPRRSARRRTYRYRILNSATPSPLARRFACRIPQPLDARRMQAAADMFIGAHDFRRFAAHRPDKPNSVRCVSRAALERSGDTITFEVVANAFLHHQVRRMAGALADVGRGRLSLDDLRTMIDNGQTDKMAHSLPPQGLCLMSVEYADFPPRANPIDEPTLL